MVAGEMHMANVEFNTSQVAGSCSKKKRSPGKHKKYLDPGDLFFLAVTFYFIQPTRWVGHLNSPFPKGHVFTITITIPNFGRENRRIAKGTTNNLSGVPILASHTLPCRTSRSVAHQHSYIHGDEWTSISWTNHTESWTSKAEMRCVSMLYQSYKIILQHLHLLLGVFAQVILCQSGVYIIPGDAKHVFLLKSWAILY